MLSSDMWQLFYKIYVYQNINPCTLNIYFVNPTSIKMGEGGLFLCDLNNETKCKTTETVAAWLSILHLPEIIQVKRTRTA